MKITVVTSYFPTSAKPYGGNSAFQTLLRLRSHAEIEVICPLEKYPQIPGLHPARYESADCDWKPPEFETTYFHFPVLPLLTRPFNGRVCAKILLPYVRLSKPDLILNYWLYPDGYAAVQVGRQLGVPVVVCAIGSDLRARTDRFTKDYVRQTMQEADAVLTVSEELRAQAIAQGIAPSKVTAILNGCDTAVFHDGDRAVERLNVGIEAGHELVVYAGNLLNTKGLSELLEAFITLSKSRPQLRLAIIGQGPHREPLAKRAAEAGVTDWLIMPGREDAAGIARWMRASNVFCLPSYSEGCPNVVVEALACGRPVVATNVGGIPELVHESNGMLVAPRDTEGLRIALEQALSRSWDSAEIARTSTRSWETVSDETWAVCERVTAKEKSAPSLPRS